MSSPADPSRVYVGNVNFSATEDELKEFFLEFNAVSAEIPSKTITRGERSYERRLGFGFVQFSNEEDADKAISHVDGKKFKLRQIFAKKAYPPATEEEKQKKREAYIAKQAELKAKKQAEKQGPQVPTKEDAASEQPEAESTPTVKSAAEELQAKLSERKKSKDTVFITNLDYKANVKTLNDLFKDLDPVWVNVPTKRVPFNVLKKYSAARRPIFNKGIAFVKFEDETTQLEAIKQFNGRDINGRKIVLEVAVDRPISNRGSSSGSNESSEISISAESGRTSEFTDATPGSTAV